MGRPGVIAGCGECHGKFDVPKSVAGKKIRCPSCRAIILVPASDSQTKKRSVEDERGRSAPVKKKPAPKPNSQSSAPRKKAERKTRPTREETRRANRSSTQKRKRRATKDRRSRVKQALHDPHLLDYDDDLSDYGDEYSMPRRRAKKTRKSKGPRDRANLRTAGEALYFITATIILVFVLILVVSLSVPVIVMGMGNAAGPEASQNIARFLGAVTGLISLLAIAGGIIRLMFIPMNLPAKLTVIGSLASYLLGVTLSTIMESGQTFLVLSSLCGLCWFAHLWFMADQARFESLKPWLVAIPFAMALCTCLLLFSTNSKSAGLAFISGAGVFIFGIWVVCLQHSLAVRLKEL